jgi:hypothetical protein
VVWQKASNSSTGPLDITGLPCVGEDGSVIMLDANYALVRVAADGAPQQQLTQQYEYGSHLLRLADGGLLQLSGTRLRVLDSRGQETWRHEAGGNRLFSTPYISDSALGVTQSGTALVVADNTLYGIRPLRFNLAPAAP